MDNDPGEASGGGLHVSSTTTDGRMIVPVVGEVDHETSPRLSDELAFAVTSGVRCVEVDFSQVSFCDCSGLNALLSARERAQAAGVCFCVLGPVTPVVERLFGVTEVESVLLRVA